ncbi:hypothetical protein Gpo141_00004635, partial [Globisporangium polare]
VKWQKFFELQVQEPEADADTEPKVRSKVRPKVAAGTEKPRPKLPNTMREWEMLADSALGLSYAKPFVPPCFSFAW